LGLDWHVDHDSTLKTLARILGEEWDVENHDVLGGALLENAIVHQPTHSWMHDRIQALEGFWIAEHDIRHRRSIESSVGCDDVIPERLGQFDQYRRAGKLHFPRDRISVDDDGSALTQKVRDGGFTGTDATCESDQDHDVTLGAEDDRHRGRTELSSTSRYSPHMSEPTSRPARIVIADDHGLFRQLLAGHLRDMGHTVVGEAADGAHAVRLTRQHEPDLVLMDVAMPHVDGITALKDILSVDRRRRVVMLSMHVDAATVRHALAAGARGYLSKDCDLHDLDPTIRSALDGDVVMTPDVRDVLTASPEPTSGDSLLTEREQEVLHLVAEGATTSEIADRLFISQKTVKNHLASVYDKLDVDDRTQAVVRAARLGLVRIERK
jgi:two-component system response regulator DegU